MAPLRRCALLLSFLAALAACGADRQHPEDLALARDLVARVDDDGDGRISLAEYERYGNGRDPFLLMDPDGDGFAEPDDVLQAIRTRDPGWAHPPPAQGAPAGSASGEPGG